MLTSRRKTASKVDFYCEKLSFFSKKEPQLVFSNYLYLRYCTDQTTKSLLKDRVQILKVQNLYLLVKNPLFQYSPDVDSC